MLRKSPVSALVLPATAALAAACAFAGPLVACGSSEPVYIEVDEEEPDAATFARDGSVYDSAPSPDSGLGELRFSPGTSYSGHDGAHTFKVPIAVYDHGADLRVTASDPSAADIAPVKLANPVNADGVVDTGTYFMITVKKAGDLTLTATSGGRTATATVKVTPYDPARWTAGKTRYEAASTSGDPPCTNCHVNGAAIDHSPASMASADDTKLGTVITNGISPAGFPIKNETTKQHRWDVTDTEKNGLVTYLRGLEPRGFE